MSIHIGSKTKQITITSSTLRFQRAKGKKGKNKTKESKKQLNDIYKILKNGKLINPEKEQVFIHKLSAEDYIKRKRIHEQVLKQIENQFDRITSDFVQRMIRINLANLKETLDHYYCTETCRVIPHFDNLFINAFKNLKGKMRNVKDQEEIEGLTRKIKKNMMFLREEFITQRKYIKEEYLKNYHKN